MDNEKSQTSSGANDEEAILSRLRKIEEGINEVAELRKRRSLVTAIGLVLIILIIGVFFINLYNFAANYPVGELTREVQASTARIGQSEEVENLMKEIHTNVFPALKKEITKKFESDIPKFQKEVLVSADNIKNYLDKDLKSKLLEEMVDSLAMLERELLSRYPDITPKAMEEAIKEAETEFILALTACVEKRLNIVLTDVLILNDSFEHLKNDSEYKNLKPEMATEIKANLVEALLELAIYHVNPNKGKMPAPKKEDAPIQTEAKVKEVTKPAAVSNTKGGVK